MGADMQIHSKLLHNAFQYPVSTASIQRLATVNATVAFTAEHVVIKLTGMMLQIQRYCFHNSVVDGKVTVVLTLPGVPRLDLKYGERGLKAEITVNKAGEAKLEKVADSKTEVDAADEEHVITVTSVLLQVVGNPVDVINAFDRLSTVILNEHRRLVFVSRENNVAGQLTLGLQTDLDKLIFGGELDDVGHSAYSFSKLRCGYLRCDKIRYIVTRSGRLMLRVSMHDLCIVYTEGKRGGTVDLATDHVCFAAILIFSIHLVRQYTVASLHLSMYIITDLLKSCNTY